MAKLAKEDQENLEAVGDEAFHTAERFAGRHNSYGEKEYPSSDRKRLIRVKGEYGSPTLVTATHFNQGDEFVAGISFDTAVQPTAATLYVVPRDAERATMLVDSTSGHFSRRDRRRIIQTLQRASKR